MITYEIRKAAVGKRWQLWRQRHSGVQHLVPGCASLPTYDDAWNAMMRDAEHEESERLDRMVADYVSEGLGE